MAVNPARYRDHMTFLEAATARLREENYQLKRTIKGLLSFVQFEIPPEIDLTVPEDRDQSWTDLAKKLNALNNPICQIVEDLAKATQNSVHYDEIIRTVEYRYPGLYAGIGKDPHGTITARCRELRKQGFLITPLGEKGRFLPGPRLVKGERP
jgi:hypothetical protein